MKIKVVTIKDVHSEIQFKLAWSLYDKKASVEAFITRIGTLLKSWLSVTHCTAILKRQSLPSLEAQTDNLQRDLGK
jgi:hypothetical protein